MEEQKWYKKKKFAVPIITVLMTGLAMAVVYIATLNVSVTVGEPLSVTSGDITVANVFPNDVDTETVTIQNDASVFEYADLDWIETSNPSGVTYTTTLPSVPVTLSSGANNLPVTFSVEEDSNVGTFTGYINITRVASP